MREDIIRKYKPIRTITYSDFLGYNEQKSTVSLYRIAPNTIYTIVTGRLKAEPWKIISAEMSEIVVGNYPCTIFHDWFDMGSYQAEARVYSSEWARKHIDYLGASHVGTQSKIVLYGSYIVGIALGGKIVAYGRKEDFFEALKKNLLDQDIYL